MKFLIGHFKSDSTSNPHVFLVNGDQAIDLTACDFGPFVVTSGEVVEVEIEGIGICANPVVAEESAKSTIGVA